MKKERFDCKTARNISIESVLSRLGLFPQRNLEKEAWYLSPFRSETKASFKVSKVLNRWYDHGEGCGGNVIDLVVLLKNCTVSEALGFLKEESESFSFQQPEQSKRKAAKNYEIVNINNIKKPALISYLHSRKIDVSLAKKYCKELHYYMNTAKSQSDNAIVSQKHNAIKPYYAIAILNDKGGYEIRNKYFKGCIGAKAITTINNGSGTLNLFEGAIDFLSYLKLYPESKKENFIVTNSTALVKNTLEFLPSYDTVKTFFDLDISGVKATKLIQVNCKKEFINESLKFKNHKDVNDYLISLSR
tara:strand:+ start:2764 stop:3672 length:909 start_codon:yes stop_codon:yes gene_type:complete